MTFPSDNGEFIVRSNTYNNDTNFPAGDSPYDNVNTQGIFHSTSQAKFGSSGIKFPQTTNQQHIILGIHNAFSYLQIAGSPTRFFGSRHIDFWMYIDQSMMTARNNYYNDFLLNSTAYGYPTQPYEYSLFTTINSNTSNGQTPYISFLLKPPNETPSIYLSKTYYNTQFPIVNNWMHIYIGIAQVFQNNTYRNIISLGVNGDVNTTQGSTHAYNNQYLSSNLFIYGIPGYLDQIRFFNFDDIPEQIYTQDFTPYEMPYPIYVKTLESSNLYTTSFLQSQAEIYSNSVYVSSNITYKSTKYGIKGNVKEFLNSTYTNYKDCKIFIYDILSGALVTSTIPNEDGYYEALFSSNNNVYAVCINTNTNKLYSSLIRNNIQPGTL